MLNIRRVTKGGTGGGGLSFPFSKSGKEFPDCGHLHFFGKNVLIVVIYGFNFSFKMQFLRVSRRKKTEIFRCGGFLSRVVHDCLSNCTNSKKTPLP